MMRKMQRCSYINDAFASKPLHLLTGTGKAPLANHTAKLFQLLQLHFNFIKNMRFGFTLRFNLIWYTFQTWISFELVYTFRFRTVVAYVFEH